MTIEFATVVKLSVRTLEPVPVPLGGWLTRPRLRPMMKLRAVGERDVAADVEQVQVAADVDARSAPLR